MALHSNTLKAVKASLALGCVSVLIAGQAAPVHSQVNETADTGVYGKNVARVDWDGGSYRMISDTEWGRFDANGTLIRRYRETSRDDWGVYFSSPDGYNGLIDMLYNQASESSPGSDAYERIGKITSAVPRADMQRVALPPPPNANYQDIWDSRFAQKQQSAAPWQGAQAVSTSSPQSQPSQSTSAGAPVQAVPQPTPWEDPRAQSPQTAQNTTSQTAPSDWNSTASTASAQSATPPWASSEAPASSSTPPWADSTQTSEPASAVPPWQQQSEQNSGNTPSAPPWVTNSSANSASSNSGQRGFGASQPADSFAPYEGVWVELNKQFREKGDGISGPIVWETPRIITLRKVPNGQVILRYHDNPSWFTPLSKRSDTNYSDGRTTASFSKSGETYYLELSGPNGTGGSFELARTADGVFSRDRFDKMQGRESRRSLYTQEGLTGEWNNAFFSYDALEMDLFRVLRGRRVQIIKQPGDFEYAIEDNLNIGLPWGLRGYRFRSSDTRQTETIITNAATFQDEMSYNFGGGASTPKGSFGANYSREFSGGGSTSSSKTKALGITRIERFALIADKPNMQLSDNFRRSLNQLIEGRTTPQQIINTYGTHYANAIHYGGIGRAERSMTSTEISSYISEKYAASANAGVGGASLSGGFSQAKSSSSQQSLVFSIDQFTAIGGSGSMSLSGWTVDDKNTVPVRYDLRPLSDFISPIFFPSDGDQQKVVQQNRARAQLAEAIAARMRSAPKSQDRYIGPKIYRVDFKKLYCTDNGDEGSDTTVEIYGKILFGYHDDNGSKAITLLDHTEASPTSMNCGASSTIGKSLTQSTLVVLSPNSPESRQSGFGRFYFNDSQLYEDDNSFTDRDDRIRSDHQGQPLLSSVANGRTQTATFGIGSADPPTLRVDYTVTELK